MIGHLPPFMKFNKLMLCGQTAACITFLFKNVLPLEWSADSPRLHGPSTAQPHLLCQPIFRCPVWPPPRDGSRIPNSLQCPPPTCRHRAGCPVYILSTVPLCLQPENRLLCLNAISPVRPFRILAMATKSTSSMLCTYFY